MTPPFCAQPGELVKLQSWVVKTGACVVILFEGRDTAGKGGVIKRIDQRLTFGLHRAANRLNVIIP